MISLSQDFIDVDSFTSEIPSKLHKFHFGTITTKFRYNGAWR